MGGLRPPSAVGSRSNPRPHGPMCASQVGVSPCYGKGPFPGPQWASALLDASWLLQALPLAEVSDRQPQPAMPLQKFSSTPSPKYCQLAWPAVHLKAWALHLRACAHHLKAHHLKAWAHHLNAWARHLKAWAHHLSHVWGLPHRWQKGRNKPLAGPSYLHSCRGRDHFAKRKLCGEILAVEKGGESFRATSRP